MIIDTDVANRAILQVGARGQVASLQTEKTNEARYVRAFYETTLRALLRSAHWNFARKFAYMTQLKSAPGALGNTAAATVNWQPATQPPPPWLFEYAYPADCLKFRYISPQVQNNTLAGTPIFAVPSSVPVPVMGLQAQRFIEARDDNIPGSPGAAKVILSNQAQALGCYTTMVDNPDLWDPQFMQAFECALGVRVAIPLSGDKKLAADAREEAKAIILAARVSDGNEGLTFGPSTERVPDWLAVRGYAGDWSSSGYFLGAFDNPAFLMI